MTPIAGPDQKWIKKDFLVDGTIIAQTSITITETCCVVVSSALMTNFAYSPSDFEIEQPLGTIKSTLEDSITSQEFELMYHGVQEILTPGTYTYFLVNRSGTARDIYGAWIKATASDCMG